MWVTPPPLMAACMNFRRKIIIVHIGGVQRCRSAAPWEGGSNNRPRPPPVHRLGCGPCPSLLTESGRCHRQQRGEKQRRLRQKRRPGRTIRHDERAGTQVRTIRQRRLGVKGGSRGGGQQCAFDAMMEVAIYLFVGSRLPARRPPDIMIAPSITIH